MKFAHGKLTVTSSTTLGGVSLSGGQVNLYKVAGAVAGLVILCRSQRAPHVEGCNMTAVARVDSMIREQVQLAADGPAK